MISIFAATAAQYDTAVTNQPGKHLSVGGLGDRAAYFPDEGELIVYTSGTLIAVQAVHRRVVMGTQTELSSLAARAITRFDAHRTNCSRRSSARGTIRIDVLPAFPVCYDRSDCFGFWAALDCLSDNFIGDELGDVEYALTGRKWQAARNQPSPTSADAALDELLLDIAEVDHVTVYRCVKTFTAEFIDAARPTRHAAGDRWFVDSCLSSFR